MAHLSLVIFTVFAQAAAGLVLMLFVRGVIKQSQHEVRSIATSYIVALGLLVIGGFASMTHLSQPQRAFNVILGFAHGSPLSLEIVGVGLFGTLLAATIYWIIWHESENTALAAGVAFAGVVMVYLISQVYTLPTVELWNSHWTTIQFFMTSILLGVVLITLLSDVSKLEQFIVLVTIGILLIALPYMGQYGSHSNVQFAELVNTSYMSWRLLLLGAGVICLLVSVFRPNSPKYMSILSVLLLFSSELAGRAYFYELIEMRLL